MKPTNESRSIDDERRSIAAAGSDRTVLRLNQWQTLFAAVSLCVVLGGGGLAWAKGWLNLPDKVTKVEQAQEKQQELLMTLPPRMDLVEKNEQQMSQRFSIDHDVNVEIAQSLKDIREQTAEMRQDIKEMRNHAVMTTR